MTIVYVSIFLLIVARTCNGIGGNVQVPGSTINVDTSSGISVGSKNDSTTITYGRPECKNCTDYLNGHVDTYRNALAQSNISALVKDKIPECTCLVKYIDQLILLGDQCTSPVPNQPKQHDTKVILFWKNITINCQCQFKTQNDMMNAFVKVQKSATACVNNNTDVDLTDATDSLQYIANDPILKSLQECAASPAGQSYNPNEVIDITAVWTNYTNSLVVRKDTSIKGPQSAWYLTGGVVNRNLTNLVANCNSDSVETSQICSCLAKSKALVSFIENIAQTFVQCAFNKNTDAARAVYDSYLVCDN